MPKKTLQYSLNKNLKFQNVKKQLVSNLELMTNLTKI